MSETCDCSECIQERALASRRKHADAIAAAEERGRRAGIEEGGRAARAAKEVHEYCLHMFQREWLDDPENRSVFAARIFAILDAALAPRDSGKVKHYDCALPEGSDTELPDKDG